MTETKETIVAFYNRIADFLEANGCPEDAERMRGRAAQQAKKAKSSGESKTSKENKEIADVLLDAMVEGEGYTATMIANMGIAGIGSSSKATSILKILTGMGAVANAKVKGTSIYTKVGAEA